MEIFRRGFQRIRRSRSPRCQPAKGQSDPTRHLELPRYLINIVVDGHDELKGADGRTAYLRDQSDSGIV